MPDPLRKLYYWLRGVGRRPRRLALRWEKTAPDSWLAAQFPGAACEPEPGSLAARIETLAARTQARGTMPVWDAYPDAFPKTRAPDDMRTNPLTGRFYSQLVRLRRPQVVVEFGAAFGVSGMYWLAGLEAAGGGELLSFEPNRAWAEIASENLRAVSPRFTLTVGTFEDHVDGLLAGGRRIDLAFVDGIHTREWVMPQVDRIHRHLAPGGLVVLDDINLTDGMRGCWRELSQDARFRAAVRLDERVGLLEAR